MLLKRSLGWFLATTVVLAALILWQLPSDVAIDLSTTQDTFTFFAKLCAFAGFSLYAWTLILSSRLKFLENLHGGLDKMLKTHRALGELAIVLILFHPIFLSIAQSPAAFEESVNLLFRGDSWMLIWGEIALWGMVGVTFFTLWIHVKYNWFLQIHRWFGVFLIPSMLHAFLASGYMTNNKLLRRYLLVLGLFALASFLYQSVFGGWLKKRYRYKVSSTHRLAGEIIEIKLRPVFWPIVFTPGQFAYVSFKNSRVVSDEPHPYSFASSNRESTIRFVVKNLGDYTNQLLSLKPGSIAFLEGPYGGFSYLNYKNKRQIWVAGGIGITPFLSMAASLPKRSKYNIDLYYCTKTKAEAVFMQEIKRIAYNRTQNLRVFMICEESDGFLTADTIQKYSGEVQQKEVLICGPPVMMKILTEQIKNLNTSTNQIHFEEFMLFS